MAKRSKPSKAANAKVQGAAVPKPRNEQYRVVRVTLERPSRAISERLESHRTEANAHPAPEARFERAAERFEADMLALWNYVQSISVFATATAKKQHASFMDTIVGLMNRKGKVGSRAVGRATIFLAPRSKPEQLERAVRDIASIQELKQLLGVIEERSRIKRLLHETAIQHIANVFESLLGDLYGAHYHAHPEAIPDDRSISFRDVIAFENIDAVREHVIVQEAQRFVHEPTEKQIELIDRFVKGRLRQEFTELDCLLEVLLRRHAIVHARGRASADYLRRTAGLKLEGKRPPSGGQLVTDAEYVVSAFNTVFAAGVIIAEMCWKRSISGETSRQSADEFLVSAGLSALEQSHHIGGLLIFQYQHSASQSEADDMSKMIARINLAQAYKWMEVKDKADQLASKASWKSSNPVFQLCAAAIREDDAEFQRLLPHAAKEEEFLSAIDMYKWPVFGWMRKRNEFDKWVEQAFGAVLDSPPDVAIGMVEPAASHGNGAAVGGLDGQLQ